MSEIRYFQIAVVKKVCLLPEQIKCMVDLGLSVTVEEGAGQELQITDRDFLDAGAKVASPSEIYKDKDLILTMDVEFLNHLDQISPLTTIFALLSKKLDQKTLTTLHDKQITLVWMDQIVQSPKKVDNRNILSKVAVQHFIDGTYVLPSELTFVLIDFDERMVGAIHRIGNRNPKNLIIMQSSLPTQEFTQFDDKTVFVYDKKTIKTPSLIDSLSDHPGYFIDLAEFEAKEGEEAIRHYRNMHPPFPLGDRSIQHFRENGHAATHFAFQLLQNKSIKAKAPQQANVVLLGYGRTCMGVLAECMANEIPKIQILTRRTTQKSQIENYLKEADIIINGIKLPEKLRGKEYIISKHHVENCLTPGTIVVDTINLKNQAPGPIENMPYACENEEHYTVENEVYLTAKSNWAELFKNHEATSKISRQITDLFLTNEKLIYGISTSHKGVYEAIVTGPWFKNK